MTILLTAPKLTAYDAVSNDLLAMLSILRNQGHVCKVYAEHRQIDNIDFADKKELSRILADKSNLLIYHHGVYWEEGKHFLKKAKCKIVFRYHNITPPKFYEKYNEIHEYACVRGGEQTAELVHDFPDAYWLCNSRFTANEVGVRAEKIAVCPPFSNIEEWTKSEPDEEILSKLRKSKEINLLFVGRVAPNKGHLFLVDIIHTYVKSFDSKIKLWIVGGTDKNLRGYLSELEFKIKTLGLEQCITLCSEVNDSRLLAYYKGCDFFVSASEHEGFLVPIAEAQYLGLPIIARSCTAVPETLGDGGIALGDDPRQYAAAVNVLYKNDTYRNFLTNAGYDNFNSRFSNATITETFIQFIEKCAKQHKPQRSKQRKTVAMITTWNTKCGIAEYTKYYAAHASKDFDYQIWPPKTDDITSDDSRVAGRVWTMKGDPATLISSVANSKPDIIHIQYAVDFYYTSTIAELIRRTQRFSKTIVTCHNTMFFIPENARDQKALNRAYYVVHQENDAAQLATNGIVKDRIRIIPLGQISYPDRDKYDVRQELNLSEYQPILGSYGFLLQHKGVCEIIKAVALLKEKYPKIMFIACNALRDSGTSLSTYNECLELISSLGLTEHVKMETDFKTPEESIRLLQACDLCALPYYDSPEGASGAVRFCVAARRPLLLTDRQIFAEYRDTAFMIKDSSPESIADGVEELLTERVYEKYSEAVKTAASRHTWEETARLYEELYNE